MEQSLTDLINAQEPEFVLPIMESSDIAWLNQQLKRTRSVDKKAIITARIQNLNHLIT